MLESQVGMGLELVGSLLAAPELVRLLVGEGGIKAGRRILVRARKVLLFPMGSFNAETMMMMWIMVRLIAARSRTDFDKERALLATEFGVAVEFNYETPGEKEVSASSTEEMKQLKGFLANPKLLKILKFFLPGVNLDPEVDVSFHGWQLAFSLFLAVTLVITIPILFSVLMLRRLFKPLRFLAGRFDSKVRIFPGKQRMTWSVATWAPRVILGVVYYEIVKVPLWLLEFVGALSQFGIYISSVNISAFLRSARWARAAASFGAFLFISGLALQFAGSFRE